MSKTTLRLNSFLLALGAVASVFQAAICQGATADALRRVRSFEYIIQTNTDQPNFNSTVSKSPSDLLILGGGSYDSPLNRSAADPTGTKLLFGYVNVAEAQAYMYPALFATSPLPSWFGKTNPGYTALYSVQFWNPAWKEAVYGVIDTIVGRGYDGVFLDVLDGDGMWLSGNVQGNPINPNATAEMVAFVGEIRAHLNNRFPGRTFFLIGNNPSRIAQANPAVLKNLDAIFNEWVFYGQLVNDGRTTEYKGTQTSVYVRDTLSPIYATAGIPVFGNDYPNPITDRAAAFLSFEYYSTLGWVPSVVTAASPVNIFTTGPFMFMATSLSSSVTGQADFVNFLSGGVAPNATLVGGNKGDYFLGGPGQNTIRGGAGDDTIYAHPASAANKGKLTFEVSATVSGQATTPAVTISINDTVVYPRTTLTALTGTTTQKISLSLSQFPTISSVVLTVSGASFVDQNNFSHVRIYSVNYNGVPVDRAAATYQSGSAANLSFTYSNNGTVRFPASAFVAQSPFLANTSDNIDGGGGRNTVVYRANYSDYRVTKNVDGSWLVTARSTAEGPDTLRNIQTLVFADQTITLNDSFRGTIDNFGHLINLSILAPLASATDNFSLGYVVSGTSAAKPKPVVIRAAGPSLAALGVTGALPDPKLELFAGATKTAENDDWSGASSISTAMASVGAFPYSSSSSRDAALVANIVSADNSVRISNGATVPSGTGLVIAEVYDATPPADFDFSTTPRLVNFSVLKRVDSTVTLGFVVGGTTSITVLVRAVGPTLGAAPFNVPGVMADPKVELFDSAGKSLATNNDWGGTTALANAFTATGAFALGASSKDSALVVTLAPGGYSVAISANGVTGGGLALVEVYEVP